MLLVLGHEFREPTQLDRDGIAIEEGPEDYTGVMVCPLPSGDYLIYLPVSHQIIEVLPEHDVIWSSRMENDFIH